MRPATVTALTSLAMMALFASPSLAIEGIARPAAAPTLVTRVADKAAPKRRLAPPYRAPRFRGPWYETAYWRERTGANRWLHFQYVNAGFPVRHYPWGIYSTWRR